MITISRLPILASVVNTKLGRNKICSVGPRGTCRPRSFWNMSIRRNAIFGLWEPYIMSCCTEIYQGRDRKISIGSRIYRKMGLASLIRSESRKLVESFWLALWGSRKLRDGVGNRLFFFFEIYLFF